MMNDSKSLRGQQEENHELLKKFEKQPIPPLVSIRLFGGLEVTKGMQRIDCQVFGRQKTKVLLALLVVNQGRELSREKISETLWPESYARDAHRNLYSLWSLLKKALAVEDGSCPYLIKTQYSYMLNESFVTSDISQLNELSSKLLFEEPSVEECTSLYKDLTDVYRGELLPSEESNDMVLQARDKCRIRFVDACSLTARRLYEYSHYEQALWFAREAIMHDSSREEMYTLLMQIQIILGQRTADRKSVV